MSQRESKLLWLKDVLEHLNASQKQLEYTTNAQAIDVLTESMIRDLECCRKLCQAIQRRAMYEVAA